MDIPQKPTAQHTTYPNASLKRVEAADRAIGAVAESIAGKLAVKTAHAIC